MGITHDELDRLRAVSRRVPISKISIEVANGYIEALSTFVAAVRRGFSYISSALLQGQAEQAGTVSRIPADEIEALVVRCVRGHLNKSTDIESAALIHNHVVRVDVQSDQLVIELANPKGANPKRKRSRNVVAVPGHKDTHQPDAAKFSCPKPDRLKTPAPSVPRRPLRRQRLKPVENRGRRNWR
jgi:hypothetical protein